MDLGNDQHSVTFTRVRIIIDDKGELLASLYVSNDFILSVYWCDILSKYPTIYHMFLSKHLAEYAQIPQVKLLCRTFHQWMSFFQVSSSSEQNSAATFYYPPHFLPLVCSTVTFVSVLNVEVSMLYVCVLRDANTALNDIWSGALAEFVKKVIAEAKVNSVGFHIFSVWMSNCVYAMLEEKSLQISSKMSLTEADRWNSRWGDIVSPNANKLTLILCVNHQNHYSDYKLQWKCLAQIHTEMCLRLVGIYTLLHIRICLCVGCNWRCQWISGKGIWGHAHIHIQIQVLDVPVSQAGDLKFLSTWI